MDHVPSQPTSDMLSVLVVDDDRELRETLSLFLRDCGCYVTAAAGGVEGLQAGDPHPLHRVGPHTPPPRSGGVLGGTTTPRPGPRGRLLFFTGEQLSPRGNRPPPPARVLPT